MTAFDVVAILIVLVSALIGFARGAVREVVSLVAFGAAAVVALLALPFVAPLLGHMFKPAWVAAAAAVVLVFVLVYVLLRVFGGQLARAVHGWNLGGADRALGGCLGVVRALIVLGGFFLLYEKAVPANMSPRWIAGGVTWPVARVSGHALAALAPSGGRLREGVGRLMGSNVKSSFGLGNNITSDDQNVGVQFGGDSNETSLKNAETPDETARPNTTAGEARRRGLQVELKGGHAAHVHHAVREDQR